MGTAKYEDTHLIDMLRKSLNKQDILIPWFRYCQGERSALYPSPEEKVEKGQASDEYVDIPTAHTFLSMLARTPLLPSSSMEMVLPLPSERLTGKTTFITFDDKNGKRIEERDEPGGYYININPRLSQFPSGDPDIKLNYTKIDNKNVAVYFGDETHVIFKLHVIYWLHAFMIPQPVEEDYVDAYKKIIPKQQFRIGQAAVTVIGGGEYRDLFPFCLEDAKKCPPKKVLFVDIHDDLHDKPPKPIVQRTLEFGDGIFQQSYDSDYYDTETGRGRYFTSALYNWLQHNGNSYKYVVLPDKGAQARFMPMLQTHFGEDEIFYCDAFRGADTKIVKKLDEVVKGAIDKMREAVKENRTLKFLIVDDFTMAGGTLNKAAINIHEAVENGKTLDLDIDAWVTHATFNYEPAVTVFAKNNAGEERHAWKINNLITTDSCPMAREAQKEARKASSTSTLGKKLQITVLSLDRLLRND